MEKSQKASVRIGWADITDVLEVRTNLSVNMMNDGATVAVRTAELTKPGVSFAGNVVISAWLMILMALRLVRSVAIRSAARLTNCLPPAGWLPNEVPAAG